MKILVTGAGGFIGSHLVDDLKILGHWVRGVDIKKPEWGWPGEEPDEFYLLDLRRKENCLMSVRGIQQVYDLAADMGGIGYIHSAHAQIAYNNSTISTNMLDASYRMGVGRYLFSSSACVYPLHRQTEANVIPLKESDAWPAQPEDAYGLQKLSHEEMCRYYQEDLGIETRVARFHNIYGPYGTWTGGKEKVPAALSRKVAIAKLSGNPRVEIWGDGLQTRSFCYVTDCIHLLRRLMLSDYRQPLNIGTDHLITVNGLARLIASVAGMQIQPVHIQGTQGVRGRNADLTLMREILGAEPEFLLDEGLSETYGWIEDQVRRNPQLWN